MTCSPTAGARVVAVLGATLALVCLSGCSASGVTASASAGPSGTASSTSPTSPTPSPPPPMASDIPRTNIDSRSAPRQDPPQAPERVGMASLQIDMPVVPVGLAAGGDVSIPSASHTAGWYRYSSGYTARSGTIVLVAHVDAWDGIGPFSRLRGVAPGADVVVTGAGGPRTFHVDGVAQPQKAPGSLAGYFVAGGPPRLVLITCGGTFDDSTGHYRDNVVVTATPRDG